MARRTQRCDPAAYSAYSTDASGSVEYLDDGGAKRTAWSPGSNGPWTGRRPEPYFNA